MPQCCVAPSCASPRVVLSPPAGDDDVIFFPDAVQHLVKDLDPSVPYFLGDAAANCCAGHVRALRPPLEAFALREDALVAGLVLLLHICVRGGVAPLSYISSVWRWRLSFISHQQVSQRRLMAHILGFAPSFPAPRSTPTGPAAAATTTPPGASQAASARASSRSRRRRVHPASTTPPSRRANAT